jgi:hypothetical protein
MVTPIRHIYFIKVSRCRPRTKLAARATIIIGT